MARRRARNGAGSLYENKKKPRNSPSRWRCRISVTLSDGTKKKIDGYGATQREAIESAEAKANLKSAPKARGRTVKEFMAYYLDQRESEVVAGTLSIGTLATYESTIRVHIIPHLGSIHLSDLQPHHVQEWRSWLLKNTSAPTARKTLRTLSAAINMAIDWGFIDSSPMPRTSKIPENSPEIMVWTEGEVAAFLKEAYHSRMYALYYLAIATGMRQGELLGLRWQDINLEEGVILVRHTLKKVNKPYRELADKTKGMIKVGTGLYLKPPKTKRSKRSIPLSLNTIKILGVHYDDQQREKRIARKYHDHDLVFCEMDGSPASHDHVKWRYKKLQADAGIPEARFHDTRDLNASLLIAKGVDIAVVSQRLGHSRASTTWDKYVRAIESAKTRAVMDVEEMIDLK